MVETKRKKGWILEKNLEEIRKHFPILNRCVYLISNSLGAAPARTQDDLMRFYKLWAEDGVTAWEREWWNLARRVANKVARLIGAETDTVTMMTNATLCHWTALSTKFHRGLEGRNKIVMTDHDFPSMIYAVSKICEFMNWDIDIVESLGNFGIDVGNILKKVDDRTLFVATSHVYFKSAYVQDIAQIVAHARRAGALTLIDGYHAPGTLPVDVKALGVDFYVGGCLKWLCGGPGNAFLYVRPELRESLQPQLTGWFAHKVPFMFSSSMVYADDSYKFMSGTPPISSLYTALAGLDIIENITVPQIRTKSLSQTKKIMQMAKERDYRIYTPFNDHLRGGAVSVGVPHAYQMKQALAQRGVKVDFRKGKSKKADVIRVGPHFYTKDEEIHLLFDHMDSILSSGDFEGFPESSETVT